MCFLHMNYIYIYSTVYIYILYILYIFYESGQEIDLKRMHPALLALRSWIRTSGLRDQAVGWPGVTSLRETEGPSETTYDLYIFIYIYIYYIYIYIFMYIYIYMICICCIDLFLSGVNSMILISIDILHGHGRKNWTIFKSHSKSAFTPQHISDL